ncbi:MAG: hypothetical protein OHK0040_04380 [bacterium]
MKRFGLITFFVVTLLVACSPKISEIEEYQRAAKAGEKGAIKKLLKLLEYPDEEIKVKAYSGLIEAPKDKKEFIEDKLIAMLKEKSDDATKEFVVGLLGKLKSKKAVPVLKELGKDKTFRRRYVVFSAFGEIQDESVVEDVIEALSDPLEDVRKYASRALIKLGPKAIPKMMEKMPQSNDAVKGYLIRAFGELRNNQPEDLLIKEIEGANKLDVIWALGKLGKEKSLPVLLNLTKSPDYKVRIQACQALGDLNLKEAIPVLKTALNDKEVLVREWAARSLELLTGERTLYRDEKGKLALPYNIYH